MTRLLKLLSNLPSSQLTNKLPPKKQWLMKLNPKEHKPPHKKQFNKPLKNMRLNKLLKQKERQKHKLKKSERARKRLPKKQLQKQHR